MPVTSHFPTSGGGTWKPSSGTANWALVDETPHDGTATCVSSYANESPPHTDSYKCAPFDEIASGATIAWVAVSAICRQTNPLKLKLKRKFAVSVKGKGGVGEEGPYSAPTPGAFNSITYQWDTNPDTGLPWTKADLDVTEPNGFSFGIKSNNPSDPEAAWIETTQVVVSVSYVNPDAGITLEQSHGRFYADDGAPGAATALADEDANAEIPAENNVRIRLQTKTNGTYGTSTGSLTLQFREDGGEWRDATTDSGRCRMGLSEHIIDGEATAALLTDEGDFVAGEAKEESPTTSSVSLDVGEYTEHEFCMDARYFAAGHDYEFRVVMDGLAYTTYSVTPLLHVTEPEVHRNPITSSGLEVRLYDGPYPTGKRKYFPNGLLAGVEWELIRGGWFGEATITLTDPIDSAIAPTGGDRVEIWLNGVRRYRGNVGTPERSLEIPEAKSITCYGLAERLNSILVNGGYGRNYLYPGGGDVSLIAADLLSSYIGPLVPNLESVIEQIGMDVETVPLTGHCRDAMDTLVEQSGNQAVWGFDVSDTDADRFFFRPTSDTVRWKYQVGGRVKSYRHSPNYADIRNAVHLTGGDAKYPNLLPNSSFEAPVVTEASNGNLLQNPGFEDGKKHWTIHNGHIVTSHGIRTGKKACVMEAAGSYIRQSGIAVTAGTLYTFEVWLRAPDDNEQYHLLITPNVGGSAARYPKSGSFDILQGEHFKQNTVDYTAPTGCTSITIEIVDDSGHLHADDLAVYATNDIRQDGWLVETDSAVTKVEQNWAWPQAWHGSTSVRLKPTWIDGWVRFRQQPGSEVSLNEDDNFQFSIYAYNPGTWPVTVKLFLFVTEEDGGNRTEYSDPLTIPAGGTDWTQLVFAATGWTATKGDQSVRVGVEIETLCELWFDAAFFGPYDPDNPNSVYLFESKVVYDMDTDDAWVQAHTGIPQAVKDSIATYGRREAEESVESITDPTTAQNWAVGYFGINAQPITPHVVEIAGADDADIEPDGLFELLGQDEIEAAPVVRVRYSIGGDGLLMASVDLNTERPTFEGLLADMTKEAVRKAKGTTASGGNSSTGGGAGSSGHSRSHSVDSPDDHAAAEASDYGKFLHAHADNGAVEWGNIQPDDYPVFGPSGASHARGAVPDPGAAAGTTRYLREDSSWQEPVDSVARGAAEDAQETAESALSLAESHHENHESGADQILSFGPVTDFFYDGGNASTVAWAVTIDGGGA